MANQISIKGFVSSEIESRTLDTGVFISKFRMGSTESKRDHITNQWVDGPTNWFHVSAFRALAANTAMSIHKGDRIIVIGKLKVSNYLRKDGTQGTNVDIEAESIGHDLKFGVASFHKVANGRAQENNGSVGAGTDADADSDGGSGHDGSEQSWPPDSADGDSSHDSGHPDADTDADTHAGMAHEQAGESAGGLSPDDSGPDQDEEVDEATGEIVTSGAPF